VQRSPPPRPVIGDLAAAPLHFAAAEGPEDGEGRGAAAGGGEEAAAGGDDAAPPLLLIGFPHDPQNFCPACDAAVPQLVQNDLPPALIPEEGLDAEAAPSDTLTPVVVV